MTTYGTQGQTLLMDTETTLGTAIGSSSDIFYDSLTFPTTTYQSVEDKPAGKENWANNSDKPIKFRSVMENAISITAKNRTGSQSFDFFTSAASTGGFGITTAAQTTCTLDSSGNLTTTSTAGTPGRAFLVELDNGKYFPVLCTTTENVEGPTPSVITMRTASTATAGNDCIKMQTVYPQNVELSTFAHFVWNTRGTHTTSTDLAYEAAGCALSAIDTITIEPNSPVTYTMQWHAGTNTQTSSGLNAESSVLTGKVPVIDCNFEFGFSSSPTDDTWGLTRSVANLIKADIELNHSVVPIPATGGTCLSGIQGYYAVPGKPRITLEMIMDKSRWDDFEGANTDKYIHFVQPTTTVGSNPVPAWGFWFPRCYLAECPQMLSDGDYYRMTLVYEAYSAGFESTTTNNSIGMSSYYYASGGYSS